MTKDELRGFVVKHCSDEQLEAAITHHQKGSNEPLGALLTSQGKSTHYDCN
jgi:hypothetical protein